MGSIKGDNQIKSEQDALNFEFEQLQTFAGLNKKAGRIVITKSGLIGRTYNHEDLINGKIRVYTSNGKMLCTPNTLKIKGFVD